ncbi:pyridine nucleotide-disulfide oxidoreductase [compost metagenome]
MQRYEAIIIGFGKGGKTLAAALAKQGIQVAMVEQSKMMKEQKAFMERRFTSTQVLLQ